MLRRAHIAGEGDRVRGEAGGRGDLGDARVPGGASRRAASSGLRRRRPERSGRMRTRARVQTRILRGDRHDATPFASPSPASRVASGSLAPGGRRRGGGRASPSRSVAVGPDRRHPALAAHRRRARSSTSICVGHRIVLSADRGLARARASTASGSTADRGHARVGEILERPTTRVTRQLLRVDFGDLEAARRGRFSGWFWLSPRDLGYPYENVAVADAARRCARLAGPCRESRTSTRWVILVHGRAVRRSETLRAVDAVPRRGLQLAARLLPQRRRCPAQRRLPLRARRSGVARRRGGDPVRARPRRDRHRAHGLVDGRGDRAAGAHQVAALGCGARRRAGVPGGRLGGDPGLPGASCGACRRSCAPAC